MTKKGDFTRRGKARALRPTTHHSEMVTKVTRVTSTNPSSAGTSTNLRQTAADRPRWRRDGLINCVCNWRYHSFIYAPALAPRSHARTRASDKKSVHISRANKSLPQERERRRPDDRQKPVWTRFASSETRLAGLLASLVFDRFAPRNSERSVFFCFSPPLHFPETANARDWLKRFVDFSSSLVTVMTNFESWDDKLCFTQLNRFLVQF